MTDKTKPALYVIAGTLILNAVLLLALVLKSPEKAAVVDWEYGYLYFDYGMPTEVRKKLNEKKTEGWEPVFEYPYKGVTKDREVTIIVIRRPAG